MTAQYLEYVRQELIVATVDLSGATKGQLLAWLENAQFDTNKHRRKKPRIYDKESKKWITLDNPPIPGKQSHAKGSHIPLVQPVEFVTSSWRRAVLSLPEHERAWVMWCYSESKTAADDAEILLFAWKKFATMPKDRRIADKTMQAIKGFMRIAAKDVQDGILGRKQLQYVELAKFMGVCKSTWSTTYRPHWECITSIFAELDKCALLAVARSRSQQKETNSQQGIAKSNQIGHI